jgi:hypothetical protein
MAGAEKNQVRFLIENGGGRYAVSIDLKSNIQVSVLAAVLCVLCMAGAEKNQVRFLIEIRMARRIPIIP